MKSVVIIVTGRFLNLVQASLCCSITITCVLTVSKPPAVAACWKC